MYLVSSAWRAAVALLAFAILAPLSSAVAQAPASNPPPVPAAEAAAIKKLLEERFPGATIQSIARSALPGLYEVHFEDQLIYTDANVGYVLIGAMYETATKRNLTQERLRKLNRVAWDRLPLDLALKKVKGKGTRKLAVFSDADCPFCARIENELKNIDDVTIYTFLYPIDQLHPDASRKSRMIWCAPDRLAAWDAWWETKTLPSNPGTCPNPLDATRELGQKLKLQATPTLIFADGSVIPGALPAPRLEQELQQAEAELARMAASPKQTPSN